MMRKYLITGGTVLIGIVLGLLFQPLISGDNVYDQVKKFDRILNMAMRNYVDEVDTQKLTEAAIRGMLEELDPHSVYLTAEEMKGVNEDFQGSFEGVGIEFAILEDTLTVVSPISGGPSEALGIQSGDKIVKVDGENVVGIKQSDVPKKLRGEKGTTVVLEIKRNGVKDLMKFSVVRDKIPLNSVESSFVIDGTDIGVISINRFMATTHNEMLTALSELKTQGMKKLILDLRYNPGGYLDQAYKIADEFLGNNDTIVYTIGRKPEFNDAFIATNGNTWENIPVIVLVNEGSASASEIVSGAIQDQDRGLIIGETSFGKGLVQRQYPLGDGSAFRLTISRYYTPSGRCIQRSYADKSDYRNLSGRLELEEGSYIDHSLNKLKQQVEKFNEKAKNEKDKIKFDSLPLYKTRSGRTVFGAGGITPDVIIKADTITMLSREIRMKRIFFTYTDAFLSENKDFKAKYENNFKAFLHDFKITDAMMKDFRKMTEKEGIKWDADQAKKDRDFLEISIKATMARTLWDRNKSMQIFSGLDRQMMDATKYFPDAIKISKKK
ncbi:MAG: S41 family peptidase [Candidatus Kapabacteria bacterium]|nr:S41 family peptidase [Candidatus Kapabacteria bacterium]